nr:uncharacterized protein LOC129388284 [Dermacentor andersoni]
MRTNYSLLTCMFFSIGSVHDGEAAHAYLKGSPGAKGCPDKRKYIMAKYVKPEGDSFLPLSNCTRDQVKAFLESDRGRCLLTNEARLWPPLSEAILRKPIVYGSRYCSYLYKGTSVEYQPVCISQICMDVPKKPPPLHEWLMTRASTEFQVSDDLYK